MKPSFISKKDSNGNLNRFPLDKKIRVIPDDVDNLDINPEDLEEFANDKKTNFTDSIIKPIADLSAEERKNVEDLVESRIERIHDNHMTKPSLVFENGEEWVVYKNESEAKNEAIKKVRQDLIKYPEMFDDEWLANYREITIPEDYRRQKAEHESERLTEFAHKEELQDLADSFGVSIDSNDSESVIRQNVKNQIKKELLLRLKDPVEYFVNQGIYTVPELVRQPWIKTHVNLGKAATEAVEMNGIAHFLSTVDGNEVKVGDMFLYRLR